MMSIHSFSNNANISDVNIARQNTGIQLGALLFSFVLCYKSFSPKI